jgi:hypothetical protein
MRLKRAFSHQMLLKPLESRGTVFGRANLPVGFTTNKLGTQGKPYRTYGFFSASAGQTSLVNFVSKVVDKEHAASALSDLVDFLVNEGFVIEKEIGNEKAVQKVWMVNHGRVMLTVPADLFRCGRCRSVTTHNIRGVCARWRCDGRLEPYTPDAILRRQVNSLVLEKLSFQFRRALGEHFTESGDEFALPEVETEVRQKRDAIVEAVLKAFNKDRQEEAKRVALAWINRDEVGRIVDGFYESLMQSFQAWLTERDALFNEVLQISTEKAKFGRSQPKLAAKLTEREALLYKLLDQIDGAYPLSYLSDQGFLPSYAFPSDTARLISKDEVKRPVLRSLSVALREYAPANTVYMDGRKYQMIGLDFHRSPVPDLSTTYKGCGVCDSVSFDLSATLCPHCKQEFRPRTSPVLFATSFVAERAEAIGADEEYRQRAFYGGKTYLLEAEGEGEQSSVTGVSLGYHRRGEIFVTNTGLIEELGSGFLLCRNCGYWHAPTNRSPFEEHKLLHNRRMSCGGNSDRFHLGYRFTTDVLIMGFENAPPESDEFFASLKAAVIEAANTVVGSEAGEINGFTRLRGPSGQQRRDLIIYDAVAGGAGYVRKAAGKIDAVLVTARGMLEGCTCERSCYRCLRSYENQFEHKLLDKRLLITFLDRLIGPLQRSEQ